MNVLYALDTYKPTINGVAVSIERQALALSQWGHNVSIVAPGAGWKEYLELEEGIRVFRTRGVNLVLGHRLAMATKGDAERIIEKVEPDLVVFVLPFILSRTVLSVAREKKLATVAISGTVPEWVLYNMPVLAPMWDHVRPFFWRMIVAHYNDCDHVVGVTPTALRFLQENGLSRPSSAISNGVDLSLFIPKKRDASLAEKLGVPDKPTVLYTGRLDKDKCMDVLVKAIPIVRERIDAHFILGGEGTDKNKIINSVHKLGIENHVSFTGFLDSRDYPRIYSLADIFAISSPTELQSIVTLEAAASGLPIVAVNAGALPELVRQEENGFLFERGDSQQMAANIIRILENPNLRRKMRVKSRRVAEQHDFNKAARLYEVLYQQLVETHLAA